MKLFAPTCAIIVLAGCLPAAAEDRPGYDRHYYEAPPLQSCVDAVGRTSLMISSDSCILVSGETRVAVGYDSSSKLLAWHSELVSAMGVAATDLGPAFGVITLRDEGYWPEGTDWNASDGLSVHELYVALGDDDFRLIVGKAPTIISTRDDRGLDWLNNGSQGVFFPVQNDGTFPLTAATMQLSASVSDRVSVAAAYEYGETARSFWEPGAMGGRLVGVIRYDDGVTNGRLTVGRFEDSSGDGDGWSGRLSVNTVLADTFHVLAVGAVGPDQTYDALLSATAELGVIEVAGTLQRFDAGGQEATAYSGSVAVDLTDMVEVHLGARTMPSSFSDDLHLAVGATVRPREDLAINLEVGAVDNEVNSIAYTKAGLDWHITDLTKAKVSGTWTTEGSYKIESDILVALR